MHPTITPKTRSEARAASSQAPAPRSGPPVLSSLMFTCHTCPFSAGSDCAVMAGFVRANRHGAGDAGQHASSCPRAGAVPPEPRQPLQMRGTGRHRLSAVQPSFASMMIRASGAPLLAPPPACGMSSGVPSLIFRTGRPALRQRRLRAWPRACPATGYRPWSAPSAFVKTRQAARPAGLQGLGLKNPTGRNQPHCAPPRQAEALAAPSRLTSSRQAWRSGP